MFASEVFTRRDALCQGVSSRTLTELVRSGTITRIGHGVYRAGSGDPLPDPRGISRSMRAAVSHASAATWLGASVCTPPTSLHVTAPRDRGRRADCAPGVRLHRASLPAADVLVVRGAFVTTPLRTVLDVARSLPLAEAVAIGDSMCRLGLLTPDDFKRAAWALAVGPGRPAAIRVADLICPLAESILESLARVGVVLAGLPLPTPQYNVFGADGQWIGRVDFAWEAARIALECDGFEFHGDRGAFERDRRRWNALTRAGWRVVVVTWRDVCSTTRRTSPTTSRPCSRPSAFVSAHNRPETRPTVDRVRRLPDLRRALCAETCGVSRRCAGGGEPRARPAVRRDAPASPAPPRRTPIPAPVADRPRPCSARTPSPAPPAR